MIYSVVSFLALFLLLQDVSCSQYNDKAILSQMQDWGKLIYDIIEPPKKKENGEDKTNIGQYLVAALLPDAALDKPLDFSKILFKGCPKEPNTVKKMIECSTSAVILNIKSNELWKSSPWKDNKKYENHAWHGEYRLFNEGIIERLIDNFYKNGEKGTCRVFLYSYYIPCADIKGCPYWCSKLVASYNNGHTTCKIVSIGYTAVFGRSKKIKTNKTAATEYLEEIEDLHHVISDVKSYAIAKVKESNQQMSFQELMYNCLLNSPLSGCCVENTDVYTELGSKSESVVAYFVNNMVYEALNSSEFRNRWFCNATISDLDKYFFKWIKEKVHSDCRTCGIKQYNVFLVRFCSKTALDLASGFGSPSSSDLSLAKWERPPILRVSFKTLYKISPQSFRKNKMVMCRVRPFSIDSLCTRLETSPTMLSKRRINY